MLTHWGRVTHMRVSKLTIIGSDNGLSDPKLEYCWFEPWEQTSVKSLSKFMYFHSRKCICKMLSGKWRPSCFGLNVLNALSDMPWILKLRWHMKSIHCFYNVPTTSKIQTPHGKVQTFCIVWIFFFFFTDTQTCICILYLSKWVIKFNSFFFQTADIGVHVII